MALVISSCSSSQEPFFRFNSPFEKAELKGYDHLEGYDSGGADMPGDPDVLPIPSLPADPTLEPMLPDVSAGPVTSTGSGASPAPEIQVLKRGPAGSTCYTCRGKGYVFQPITEATGENHACPACGGDGRN